jgi:hypothetical protein
MSLDPRVQSSEVNESRARIGRTPEAKPAPDPDPKVLRPLPPKVEQLRGNTPDAFWDAASGLDSLDEMNEVNAQLGLASSEERAEIAAREAVSRTVDATNATTPMSRRDRDEMAAALMPEALRIAKEQS